MGLEWFRDLIICIYGIIGIIVCLLFAVIVYSLYRKIKNILSKIEEMQQGVQGIVDDVKREIASMKAEMSRPVVQAMAMFKGIREGFCMVSRMFKKERGAENEQ